MSMEITRRDLYNRVWSTPMVRLARELDISDVGLKKACKRYGIPTPARGYWAQVAAGNAPPKPGLPPAKIDTVVLEAVRHRINTPPSARDAVDFAVVRRAISAPDKPDTPISAATAEALSRAKPSPEGFVRCGSSRVFRCLLSPNTIERATAILGRIEGTLPSVNACLARDRESKQIELEVGGERLQIWIEEETTRTVTPGKPDRYGEAQQQVSYSFTGDLRLRIDGTYQGRRSWKDGKTARLEDKLPSILEGIVAAAHAQRALRLSRDEQQRRWAEEARLRAIAEGRRRQTKHFVENLSKEANAWQAYCNMKAYVDHLVHQARSTKGVLPQSSRRWLKLAAHLTRLTDPSSTRLALLHKGISGHEWNLPFGVTLSGY
jgi:hypothetical protein